MYNKQSRRSLLESPVQGESAYYDSESGKFLLALISTGLYSGL